jgi:hypothetical protein
MNRIGSAVILRDLLAVFLALGEISTPSAPMRLCGIRQIPLGYGFPPAAGLRVTAGGGTSAQIPLPLDMAGE